MLWSCFSNLWTLSRGFVQLGLWINLVLSLSLGRFLLLCFLSSLPGFLGSLSTHIEKHIRRKWIDKYKYLGRKWGEGKAEGKDLSALFPPNLIAGSSLLPRGRVSEVFRSGICLYTFLGDFSLSGTLVPSQSIYSCVTIIFALKSTWGELLEAHLLP